MSGWIGRGADDNITHQASSFDLVPAYPELKAIKLGKSCRLEYNPPHNR